MAPIVNLSNRNGKIRLHWASAAKKGLNFLNLVDDH
jgi:hypothetical protein